VNLPAHLRRDSRKPVLAAAGAALGIAALGALTTDLGPWYQALVKPAWQPPDALFGPAWTLIFALAATSFVLYWRKPVKRDDRLEVIAAFLFNGFLNTLWSLLFFRVKRPDWALYEVAFLWVSIVVMIVLVGRASRPAATLLVPYLLWVSFASFLNLKIVQLNAPFVHHG
jgi:tryptophan-rich sensory protein